METEAKLMPNGDHQRLQRSIITIPVKTFERVKNSYMFAAAWRPGVTLVDVDRLSRASRRRRTPGREGSGRWIRYEITHV
jgi:hypothetical protein